MSYTTFDSAKYKKIGFFVTLLTIFAIAALALLKYVFHVIDDFWTYFYGVMGLYYFASGLLNFSVKKSTAICDMIIGIILATAFVIKL